MYNECIDIHWMAYHDSTCDFETLKSKKAFSIERHALKIVQPIEKTGGNDDEYRLACPSATGGARQWGKIDFSRGFSQWWHLSHTDFHVPSEHTQEGKQYSGEIQMYHWYSANATVAGIHNEVSFGQIARCNLALLQGVSNSNLSHDTSDGCGVHLSRRS